MINRLLIIALVFVVASCASPSKLYKSGRYEQAVTEAVRKLRSSPNKIKHQDVLVRAYPMAVQMALRDVNNALQSNNITRYDVVINRYEQLNRMARDIYSCPKAYQLIPAPREFHAELTQTKEIAAEHYYSLGVRALNERTVLQARNAHQFFIKSNEYVRGYRDVVSKIEEALFAGILHVVVQEPKTPERFQFSADFFYSNLVTEMNRTTQKKYVHFYTPIEAKNAGMNDPHQYIVLDFIDFTVGNIRDSKSSIDVKRDSVPIEVEINGKKTTALTTVNATFTSHRREIISAGRLRVQVVDAITQRVAEQRAFEGSYTWVSNWGSFTGDDRALSTEQKKLALQQPMHPPPNQDLFVEFTRPIFSQVVSYIQSIYRN